MELPTTTASAVVFERSGLHPVTWARKMITTAQQAQARGFIGSRGFKEALIGFMIWLFRKLIQV